LSLKRFIPLMMIKRISNWACSHLLKRGNLTFLLKRYCLKNKIYSQQSKRYREMPISFLWVFAPLFPMNRLSSMVSICGTSFKAQKGFRPSLMSWHRKVSILKKCTYPSDCFTFLHVKRHCFSESITFNGGLKAFSVKMTASATAHKLIRVVYAMMTRQTTFFPHTDGFLMIV